MSHDHLLSITGHVGIEERPPDYPEPVHLRSGKLSLGPIHLLNQDDVTVLVGRELFEEALDMKARDFQPGEEVWISAPRLSFSMEVRPVETKNAVRVHAALAFGGEYYSVTMRGFDFPGKHGPTWQTEPDWRCQDPGTAWKVRLEGKNWFQLGMLSAPGLTVKDRTASLRGGYLAGQYRLGEILYKGVFNNKSLPKSSGLVLITGATASGKTQALNFLVALYLCGLYQDSEELGRRPHIVALGDPIETLFYQAKKGDGLKAIAECQIERACFRAFDFTVRVLGKDVLSVKEALRDALRETPSAYIISELRTSEDFQAALDFAATGHLVFATSHNTSLVDAMAKLVEVFEADTPSGRSALAKRLKALVHLRPVEIIPKLPPKGKIQAVLPAMWVGDGVGAMNFVSDGLASLLPQGQSKFDIYGVPSDLRAVRGLAYSAELLEELESKTATLSTQEKAMFRDLLKKAHQLDMER